MWDVRSLSLNLQCPRNKKAFSKLATCFIFEKRFLEENKKLARGSGFCLQQVFDIFEWEKILVFCEGKLSSS